MKPRFDRVSIIGAGLLGASLGLAMKTRGLAGRIIGAGRRIESLEIAHRLGAVDEITLDDGEAARDAALIVIATPAAMVMDKLDAIRDACRPDAVVTDVASTKRAICDHAAASWPRPRRFVGRHPMAGSEKFGPAHARADFYEGAVCLVEQGDGLDSAVRSQVRALWEAVGARVVDITPAEHDDLLARTSHIPHVVASALAAAVGSRENIRAFIGKGFRDVTRIAASRPELWRDICLTNREAVTAGLDEILARLSAFRDALSAGDAGAVERHFQEGKTAREESVGE